MIRLPRVEEFSHLIEVATNTGIFNPGESEELLGSVLERYRRGELGEGHQVVVCSKNQVSTALGWLYLAPSPSNASVWDVWWIGVDPKCQRGGVGTELICWAEETVKNADGKTIIIETNSTDALQKARNFYLRHGYIATDTVLDYYGKGEDKVIFIKYLNLK